MAVWRSALLSLLGCLVLRAAMAEAPLELATEDSPPLNYLENGEVTGPSVDLVRNMAERAEVPIGIEVMPWARAYQQALDRPGS
jgi:polar amino acid transport system substrate-binding protein